MKTEIIKIKIIQRIKLVLFIAVTLTTTGLVFIASAAAGDTTADIQTALDKLYAKSETANALKEKAK